MHPWTCLSCFWQILLDWALSRILSATDQVLLFEIFLDFFNGNDRVLGSLLPGGLIVGHIPQLPGGILTKYVVDLCKKIVLIVREIREIKIFIERDTL